MLNEYLKMIQMMCENLRMTQTGVSSEMTPPSTPPVSKWKIFIYEHGRESVHIRVDTEITACWRMT